MEVQHEVKPRLKYGAVFQQSKTVGMLLERYITEMESGPELKPLGSSQKYTMRLTARSPLGAKDATSLTKADIIGYCRMRRQQFVKNTTRLVGPATVGQEISYLGVVLKYAGAAWEDCEEVSAAALIASRPFLVKHNLLGKSAPRKRVPTDEEIHALLDYFAKHKLHPRTRIDMAQLMAFALCSTRRLGEICRLKREDIDWQKRTYWIRDLKHPTKKKGNDKEFPLFDELAEIIKRQAVTDDPRVFPYNSKCASQSYADAKTKLGIVGLRFHDNRRAAITAWLKKLPPHKVRQISGHETTIILERVYSAPKAEDIHSDLAAIERHHKAASAHR